MILKQNISYKYSIAQMATYEYSMPDVNGQCGGQVQFTMNTQSPPQNTEQFQQRDSNEKPQYDGPGPLPTKLDQEICSKWRRNVLNTCNRIGDTTSRSCVEARRVCLNTNNSDTQPIPPSRVGLHLFNNEIVMNRHLSNIF